MNREERKQMNDLKVSLVVMFIGFSVMLFMNVRAAGDTEQIEMKKLMNMPPTQEMDVPVTHRLDLVVQGQQDVDTLYGTMLFVHWKPGDVVFHKITDLRTGRVKYGRIVIATPPEDPPEKYFPKQEGGGDGG